LGSPHALVAQGLSVLYADYPLAEDDDFADFTVTIGRAAYLRRWLRPQARFIFDGRAVFEPLPADQAYPLLEWSMNWCVSNHAHQYLIVHAAVLERGGLALVMPAPPGSGKSTLTAALLFSGWRLLSDELALLSMADGLLWPLARPVSLKNQSIEVIRKFAPQACFNRITHDTNKGSVTHLRVPAEHLARVTEPARPRWVVYPRYVAGSATQMSRVSRAGALVDLARNAFNFSVQGEAGFDRLGVMMQACDCHEFVYSDLREAIEAFDGLAMAAR
jgi:HprK-related kinase A